MRLYAALLFVFGLVGAGATQFLLYRFLPLSDVFRLEAWGVPWMICGAIAGALSANLLWIVAKPRQRVSRGIALAVLANTVAWTAFALFGRHVSPEEFQKIRADRAEQDAHPGSMNFVTDQPIVVAARWHGTYGAINLADALVGLSADPAIGFATMVAVPAGHLQSTKQESFIVAGLAFLLSTAFWAAAGGIATVLVRIGRNRIARGQVRDWKETEPIDATPRAKPLG